MSCIYFDEGNVSLHVLINFERIDGLFAKSSSGTFCNCTLKIGLSYTNQSKLDFVCGRDSDKVSPAGGEEGLSLRHTFSQESKS